MLLALHLAFRYLRTKKKGLVRVTSFVAVAGMAVGVATLVVVQSIGRGFEREMREKILASSAHVRVKRDDEGAMQDAASVVRKISQIEGVTATKAMAFAAGTVSSPRSGEIKNVVFRIDESDEVEPGTLLLGTRIAEKFNRENSRQLTVALPQAGALTLESVGTFTTGIYEYDSTQARISKSDFAKLLSEREFVPSTLFVSVNDIFKADQVANRIRDLLGEEYVVVDWQEANRPLFSALTLERRAALVVIALIMLAAAFNITVTLALRIAERRTDIAILRTCGASASTIVLMFVSEGILLALTGIVAGQAIGFGACELANSFGLLKLPPEVYSVSVIHLQPSLPEIVVIGLIGLVAAAAASLVSALRAASVKPSENLRKS